MGHGIGATMAPMTAAVMNAVGSERAGLGSAMTNTSREVGGVFGIALLGTVLTTRLRHVIEPALTPLGLSSQQQAAVADAAGHGNIDPALLATLPSDQQAHVIDAFRTSFMSGFRISLIIGGLVLLTAAVVANRFIPGRAAAREVMAEREGLAPAMEL
jgi:tetrahydromethanopterin S-methyltransferase subunit B